jgi:antitoxin MazE
MVVNEMERKITKIGNSLGITLPQEVLDHIRAKQGDEIKFTLEDNGSVTIKKHTPIDTELLEELNIDNDFLEGVKHLFDKYDNTLRNLAKR